MGGTFQVVMFVASLLYQQQQMAKMKEAQRAAAEAAKDRAATRQIRTSGSAQAVDIPYGYTALSPDKVYVNTAKTLTDIPGSNTFGNLVAGTGKKNDYLILQKVIGFGPLDAVVAADVDGTSITDDIYNDYSRIHYFTEGGTADSWAIDTTANSESNPVASTAVFNDLAYTTEAYKMNRDDPQFGGVPSSFLYIRGRKVKNLTRSGTAGNYTYALSTTKSFSNNAILILLDYLTDSIVGPGIPTSQLKLEAFWKAKIIANTIVQADAAVEGKVFGSNTTRDIRKYEFNGILSSSNDHIDNISTIVDSLPGATIFRTADGKIGINLPDVENKSENFDYSEGRTINDTVLVDYISVTYPDASEKLNSMVVTFPNSSKNFANDSYTYRLENVGEANGPDYGIILENSVSLPGVSNKYHAAFVAEATIAMSRQSAYKFTTTGEGFLYEPGDVVRLVSPSQSIDVNVRIGNVTVNSDLTVEVVASLFNPSDYTWTNQDNEEFTPAFDFDFTVGDPTISVTSDYPALVINITGSNNESHLVNRYEVYRSTDNINFSPIGLVAEAAGVYYDTAAQLGITYYYKVKALTIDGRKSAFSNSVAKSMTLQIPLTPQISLSQTSPSTLKLSVTYDSEDITDLAPDLYFTVESKNTDVSTWDFIAKLDYPTTEYIINNIDTYTVNKDFRIIAYNRLKESDDPAEITYTIPTPNAPEDIAFERINNYSGTLSWYNGSNNLAIDYFKIESRQGAVDWTVLASVPGNSLSYTLKNLDIISEDTEYRVIAVGKSGLESSPSSPTYTYEPPVPNAPNVTDSDFERVSLTTGIITWNYTALTAATITQFAIESKPQGSTGAWNIQALVDGDSRSFEINNLDLQTENIYYRVVAIAASGLKSGGSAAVLFEKAPVAAPTNFSGTVKEKQSVLTFISLLWNDPDDEYNTYTSIQVQSRPVTSPESQWFDVVSIPIGVQKLEWQPTRRGALQYRIRAVAANGTPSDYTDAITLVVVPGSATDAAFYGGDARFITEKHYSVNTSDRYLYENSGYEIISGGSIVSSGGIDWIKGVTGEQLEIRWLVNPTNSEVNNSRHFYFRLDGVKYNGTNPLDWSRSLKGTTQNTQDVLIQVLQYAPADNAMYHDADTTSPDNDYMYLDSGSSTINNTRYYTERAGGFMYSTRSFQTFDIDETFTFRDTEPYNIKFTFKASDTSHPKIPLRASGDLTTDPINHIRMEAWSSAKFEDHTVNSVGTSGVSLTFDKDYEVDPKGIDLTATSNKTVWYTNLSTTGLTVHADDSSNSTTVNVSIRGY